MKQQPQFEKSKNHANFPAVHAAGQNEKLLRIYTLGRFSVVRDGQPLRFSRKAPQKPLLLLKALIAAGGRQVGSAHLASLVWPDSEGDLAQRSLDTALHRLRKLSGDDRILLMENGQVTLNSALCQVDVWEFEKGIRQIQKLVSQPFSSRDLAAVDVHAREVLSIYQGHFLFREEVTSWSVSIKERLRNKYIHCLVELGRYWEKHAQWNKAIMCYQKGIEVDDLVETFYQRLMLCLDKTGRKPEALAVYRHGRHVISVVLGLQPTEETQAIYESIQSDYQKTG